MKQPVLNFLLGIVIFFCAWVLFDTLGMIVLGPGVVPTLNLGWVVPLSIFASVLTMPVWGKKGGIETDSSEAKPEKKTMLLAGTACEVCGKRLEFVAAICHCDAFLCATGDCKERHDLMFHGGVQR